MVIDIKKRIEAIVNSRAGKIIEAALMSRFFPFVTAAFMLLFYYTGSDLLAVYYLGICGLAVFIFCKDVTPLFCIFLFMNMIVSGKDTPLSCYGWADKPAVTAQILTVIALYLVGALIRMFTGVKSGNFKRTPVFCGLLVFAAALFLNGAFAEDFDIRNLFFGGSLAVIFLGVFVLGYSNINTGRETFERIALAFVALGATVLVELFVVYLTTEGLIVDGTVVRHKLHMGWGTYLNAGMLLNLAIPASLYLAGRYRHGWAFTLYTLVLLVGVLFTLSRQSIISSALVFVVGAVLLLIGGNNRWINVGIFAAAALALGIYLAVRWNEFYKFFMYIVANFLNDSGRHELYENALINFRDFPVFGKGFYVKLYISFPLAAIDYFPPMFHNTFMQLMSACGTVGLVAYIGHRVQTVKSFFNNPTKERAFIALTVIGLLIMNFLDNYLFYMFPTMVYSFLIAALVKSEKKADSTV
ncbi:MAG: O-antigen ligase family protein [Roseburia sp.]|nr:O-antigen ligase family protein [Roseburia sp.]